MGRGYLGYWESFRSSGRWGSSGLGGGSGGGRKFCCIRDGKVRYDWGLWKDKLIDKREGVLFGLGKEIKKMKEHMAVLMINAGVANAE